MPLDQNVEHRESEVSQELPNFPSEEHPQDVILFVDADPAPPHRHLRGIVTNLVEAHSGDGDDQRNTPATTQDTRIEKPVQIINKSSI